MRTLHVRGFSIDTLGRAFRDVGGHSFPATQISTFLKTCAEIVREAARRRNGVIPELDDWAAILSSPLWNGLVRTLTWHGDLQGEGSPKFKGYHQSSRDLFGYQSYFQEEFLINRFLYSTRTSTPLPETLETCLLLSGWPCSADSRS
jgi:hypothetical protein